MPKVHILPPEIVSKIAAGEVIDRPASVLKELMENSIDAGADTIEMVVKDAGKTLLRIKDSGSGIDEADMSTIFQRHATSKIQNIDDLFNIHSLGFRGEALYSIAAVSDITLKSKPKNQASGWEIHLRGGEQLDLRPCSMPAGTEIEIRELFFNTPARRKFLKSNTSEMNQIINTFVPYALLYPKVRFLLKHQDKKILELASEENRLKRIAETLNLKEQFLLEASREFPEEQLSVQMVLGDINISRSRRDLQFIFINGRPVLSKLISYHLNNVYRLIMPGGQFPFFAVFLRIPASEIDVNIHPTKREVKIRDEVNLCALLKQIAEATLMMKGSAKQVSTAASLKSNESLPITQALKETHRPDATFEEISRASTLDHTETSLSTSDHSKVTRPPTEQYAFPEQSIKAYQGATLSDKRQESLHNKLSNATFVGNFLNKFLFFESGSSLLVIDQHAAQERITFEHLISQMDKGKVESQQLLAPYLIRLSPQEINVWEAAQPILEEIGFSSTLFDGETVAIHSYPVLLADPEKAVREILAGEDVARADHETLARRACRASVMSGDRLAKQQAEFMREQLLQCRDPFTCPHGRPTLIEMSENFLDKQFLRG